MTSECWICRRTFMYPRKLNICGGCYQERYTTDGKYIKRRGDGNR